jgi:hypothetical protein
MKMVQLIAAIAALHYDQSARQLLMFHRLLNTKRERQCPTI